MNAARYRITKLSYFNIFLFPFAVLSRIFDRLYRNKDPSGLDVPPRFINKLLTGILSFEGILVQSTNMPFGLSLLAIIEPEIPQ